LRAGVDETTWESAALPAEEDPFLVAHAAHLPAVLSAPEFLYAAALCVAEVAGAPPLTLV
jgi:hypothetical protein